MEAISDDQLRAMGLSIRPANIDANPEYGDWDSRVDYHGKIKGNTSQPDMPKSVVMWRQEVGTSSQSGVRCNAGHHIAKINATIVGGANLNLADEYFLCKQETATWSEKHLTSAKGNHPKNSHLNNTSDSDNYCVDNYNDYVPEQVLAAEDKYKTLYFNKYKTNNANLTIAMISVIYINFQCDVLLMEQPEIKYHLKDVHGITFNSLKPVQVIKVDTTHEFKLPGIMDIELSGPDQKALQINSIYTRSVKSGVVTKTNNKRTADLMEDQSQVFMVELSKSTPTKYFSRFEMFLRMALEGEDVRGDFTCKWWKIENSLFKAISKEQNTIRYAQFLEKDYTQFHSLPMEILINSVDAHVDGALGKSMKVFTDAKQRTVSNYGYSIKKKHELIFDIARHLGDDFKIIRQYISEKCTIMQDDIEKILDISDLQEDFKKVFENKGVLTQYTSENVPAPKKAQWV